MSHIFKCFSFEYPPGSILGLVLSAPEIHSSKRCYETRWLFSVLEGADAWSWNVPFEAALFEIQWKCSQLLSLNRGNRREKNKSFLVFAFKSSHSWCLLFTQNPACLEILPSALFPLRKSLLRFTYLAKISIITRKALCCTGWQYAMRQNDPQVHILDQICQS